MTEKKVSGEEAVGERRANFVRIAEKRVANAIRGIRLIGNLSNKAHYEFTEADIKKIVSALGREVDGMQRRFSDAPAKNKIEFKL